VQWCISSAQPSTQHTPVATGDVGADERLCVLELLLHAAHDRVALQAAEGSQVQLWADLRVPNNHGAKMYAKPLVPCATDCVITDPSSQAADEMTNPCVFILDSYVSSCSYLRL
jgi:hypothetical protein